MKRKLITTSIVLLLLLSFAGWRWFLVVGEVNRRIGAIRAAGFPVNCEELNQWYTPVPDDENAALVVTRAIGLLRDFPSSDSRYREINKFKLPQRGQQLDAKQIRLLSEFVATNTPALEMAHEAAKLPRSRYPLDMRKGMETLLPHLRLRTLAMLEQYSALLALGTSRSNQALSSVASILDLARTLEPEPIVVSQMERTRVLAYAKVTLELSLAAASFGSQELADLQYAFAKSEKTNLMGRALAGDRAVGIPVFRTNITEIGRLWSGFKREEKLELNGLRALDYRLVQCLNLDLSLFLNAMETNIAALSFPPPANLIAESNAVATVSLAKQSLCIVSAMYLPHMQEAGRCERSGLAHLRLSMTALAIERFRLSHKRLPATLDALVPEFLPAVPIDPFDCKPLRYERLAKGYTIQSAGAAMETNAAPSVGLDSDLSFTVER